MAKQINPYQGPAPAAMSQMGAGILEAGARIGQTIQSGYESMGKSIGQGIQSAGSSIAGAYGDYKKMESGVKASEKAYETFRGFLEPDVQKSIDDQIAGMKQDTSLSLQDKALFWDQAKGMMGGAINQKFALDKQQRELNAAMARQQAGEAAARDRTLLGIQARAEELGGPALPSEGGTAMPGAPFYDQGLAPQQPVNPFGSLLKKRHFGAR